MCGRYRRTSDKQRIAEAFAAGIDLDEVDFEPDDDIAPGSIQPVVSINSDGQLQIELMRWGFKLPGGTISVRGLNPFNCTNGFVFKTAVTISGRGDETIYATQQQV